jgi:hypothetical protein
VAEWVITSEPQGSVTQVTVRVMDALVDLDVCARQVESQVFATTKGRREAIRLDSSENDGLKTAYVVPVHTCPDFRYIKSEIEALLLLRRPCGRFVRVGVAWLHFPNGEELLRSLVEHEISII